METKELESRIKLLEDTLIKTLKHWVDECDQGDGIHEKDIDFFNYALNASCGIIIDDRFDKNKIKSYNIFRGGIPDHLKEEHYYRLNRLLIDENERLEKENEELKQNIKNVTREGL